jgi:chromosome segregation ATPase
VSGEIPDLEERLDSLREDHSDLQTKIERLERVEGLFEEKGKDAKEMVESFEEYRKTLRRGSQQQRRERSNRKVSPEDHPREIFQ